MTTPSPRPPIAWQTIVPIVLSLATPIALAAGVVRADAETERQVHDNTRRIAQLEAQQQPQADKQSQIIDRLARIETKLELLAPLKATVER